MTRALAGLSGVASERHAAPIYRAGRAHYRTVISHVSKDGGLSITRRSARPGAADNDLQPVTIGGRVWKRFFEKTAT
jgi:hypothetical protein